MFSRVLAFNKLTTGSGLVLNTVPFRDDGTKSEKQDRSWMIVALSGHNSLQMNEIRGKSADLLVASFVCAPCAKRNKKMKGELVTAPVPSICP